MAEQNLDGIDAGETPVMDEMSNSDASENPQGETPATDVTSAKSQKGSNAKRDAQPTATNEDAEDGDDGEDGFSAADVDELVFDNWLNKQPVQVQELVARQQKALRDALVDERNQRKQLTKQIGALQKKTEGNAVTAKELRELRSTLEETQRRARFYESLPGDLTNPKLAFAAAQMNGWLGNNGQADRDTIRREMPELFRRITVPTANAGAGAKQSGTQTEPSMNAFIRAALGRE